MKSQTDRVLEVLKAAPPTGATIQEIHAVVGPCRLNSRVADLRAKGYDIRCSRETVTPRHGFGRPHTIYRYRLLGSGESSGRPAAADASLTLDASSPEPNGPLDSTTVYSLPAVVDSSGAVQPTGIGRARETQKPNMGEHATPEAAPARTLEEYGVDRMVAELNRETPGLLVETERGISDPARPGWTASGKSQPPEYANPAGLPRSVSTDEPLSLDENRRRLAELQTTLFGRAA